MPSSEAWHSLPQLQVNILTWVKVEDLKHNLLIDYVMKISNKKASALDWLFLDTFAIYCNSTSIFKIK